jgi:endonuclease/exonuclease/phosphatase family metal-dependent hydrolase
MSTIFSVLTYNVHSGIGTDGKVLPLRIAEVIDRCNPDIVALQELDSGLDRTENIDQAHLISKTLNMSYHFHSSIRLEAGQYGNAVLSHFPLRLIKAGAIPALPFRARLERRGAVWVEIEVNGHKIQVVSTHFGLDRRERLLQANEITGPQWLGGNECGPPTLLCGDFNTLPGLPTYRRITSCFSDAQRSLKGHRPKATWPSFCPFMRLDHLFISSVFRVLEISVPRTGLTRVASDHLPLFVTLELE